MNCPNCANGKMIFNGLLLNSFPPKYLHKCNKCDCAEFYEEIKDEKSDEK